MRIMLVLILLIAVLGCSQSVPQAPATPEPAAAALSVPSPSGERARPAEPATPLPAASAPTAVVPVPSESPVAVVTAAPVEVPEQPGLSPMPVVSPVSTVEPVGTVILPSHPSPVPASASADVVVQDVSRESVSRATSGGLVMPDVNVKSVVSAMSASEGSPDASYRPSAGGTSNVNDAAYDLVFFEHHGVNPFVDVDEDPWSTFALDVDTASYTVARRFVRDGYLPDPDSVRVEEFVNYFDYGYQTPEDDRAFAIYADVAPSPFGTERHRLLRIGLKGREVADDERADANLVFAIDVSGSMERDNRIGLVKRSLYLLLDELRDTDSIAIVVYGDEGRVVLDPVMGERRETARRVVENLRTGGSTYVEDGLRLAYRVAASSFDPSETNRVVLLSDGVGNVGRTGADSILEQVSSQVDMGVTLTAVGFGMGNFNDVLMEALANRGNGSYHYVDSLADARRLFVEGLTSELEVIARDAKVQVEFDEDTVRSYRLLGYENRDIADEDFRRDDVDAGEVGAGHEVTALYEIKLHDQSPVSGPLGSVHLRYEDAGSGEVVERSLEMGPELVHSEFADAPLSLRKAAVVAEYAEILRGSYWAREGSLDDVVSALSSIIGEVGDDADFLEFGGLVARARDIQGRN